MSLGNARRRFDVVSSMATHRGRERRTQRGAFLADTFYCVWLIIKGALFTGGFLLGVVAIVKGLDALLDELH